MGNVAQNDSHKGYEPMGLDVHGIKFLRYCAQRRPFGATATLGRQGVHVSPTKLKELLQTSLTPPDSEYCERLLKEYFGSTSVTSFDYSEYEGATHILDLNKTIDIHGAFETVIDCGTMEHIFNAPQGLANAIQMCAEGGRLIHVLPANNLCNHGFWQFTPELFLSLYNQRNGFSATEIFMADLG